MLIFLNADLKHASAIKIIFCNLENFAGLKINDSKSKVYFSKNCCHKEDILKFLKFQEGNLRVKYLGLPLSANQIKDKGCNKLQEIIESRFDN